MSYGLPDKLQFQAAALKKGKCKLANVHQEIMDWISGQFNVRALDFLCEKREDPKSSLQQVIHIVLETADQVKSMHANRADAALVTERFLKYFTSGNSKATDPLKRDVFPSQPLPYPEIIVTYRPLKALSREVLEEMLADEKRAVLTTFESVWTISQQVVFFFTYH